MPGRNAGNVATWPQPAPSNIGATNASRILQACKAIRKPIAALKADLPDVGSALVALNDEVSRAVIQQVAAVSEFVAVTKGSAAAIERTATMMATREENLDPTPAGAPGETRKMAIADRAKGIRTNLENDWVTRFEQGKAKLAAQIGSAVVDKLNAAGVAVERAELRAGLDTAAPDPALVASIERTVMAEPSLRRPAKARELLDRAMKLGDTAVLLALESQIPTLQHVIEQGVPALTRNNTQHRTGMSSDAMQNAMATVAMLRALRDQRLTQPAIEKAGEILAALQWLAMKTVGIDAADPSVVSNLRSVLSPERGQAIDLSKVTPDVGKSGGRWVTRYIRSTATLKWPPLLSPSPMKLRDDPSKPNPEND